MQKEIICIFEKQSFRLTTATRIERENLEEVYKKSQSDHNYTDAISTDLLFKLKELTKFNEYLQKLDLNVTYKECYDIIQNCIFIC